jgi:cardiolipin synthase
MNAAQKDSPGPKASAQHHRMGGGARRRPRSRPALWRAARRRPRKTWRFVPLDQREKKGAATLATQARRMLWAWWLWAAFTLVLTATAHWGWAIATGILAVVTHLTRPQLDPPQIGLDHEFDTQAREFVATMVGATGTPFIGGNTFEILNNGDAFYPRMLADVRAATTSIAMEAYIYWSGEIGLEFAAALSERARAGVRVMLLLDAVGSSNIGDDILATLEAAHCQVAWYNPLRWKDIGRFNNRTHRKTLVIDGTVAYTGGAGIADHWKGNAGTDQEWRDLQVRFEGPAAQVLLSGFSQNWQQATGELLSGDAYYPLVEPRGPHALQVILSSAETGASSVQIVHYLAIVCARTSVLIANPYFVPDAVAVQTLIEAKRRGVDVQIMVSGIHNDNWLARQNSVRLFGEFLRAGVRILEFNRSMLHHKVMVVDGVWATVGTTNFDNRSFAHNEESNVCLYSREIAGQFERMFHEDAKTCDVVTLEQWTRRGVVRRVLEQAAALLEDQV